LKNMKQLSSGAGRHMMSGTIRIFLAESLILPTGFITAVFLARSLGPVGYGIFALVSRLILWVEWTSVSGFSGTTIKFVGEASDWRPISSSTIRLHIIMGVGTATILWLLASPLSSLFDEPDLSGYIRLFAVEIPVLSLASACSYILVGTGRYKEVARIRALRLIARLILIILFVEMGLSVKGAIIGSIGASVIELIISWFYARPTLFHKDMFPIRRLLSFGAPLFIAELCQRIFRLDLFALKALGATAAQAGFYGAAMNLTIPPVMFSKSLSYPLLSTLSSLLSNEEVLIFGERYIPTSPILAFLIFAAIGMLSINVSQTILTSLGKPGWTSIVTVPMIPVALIGHLTLIPLIGGIGAAIVTTFVACLGAIAALYIIHRIWGISPPLKTVVKGVLCSILAYAISSMWLTSGLALIFKLLGIVLVVLFVFFILGEFSSREKDFILSIFKTRLRGRL
jgi:O-antigen/teichoic acid export membrane protein